MKVSIAKTDIMGRVKAPSSKSYTVRGLMCAALAGGESRVLGPLSSDDTEAAVDVLSKIGVGVHQEEHVWQVVGDNFREPGTDLFCRDSAATLRFMTAICSLVTGSCRLVAGPSLAKRPVKPLVETLRQLGVKVSCQGDVAPVVVEGGGLKGGVAELPGDISSQFVSALLLVSPFAKEGVEIRLTTQLESRPYVLMTLECLQNFGIKVEVSKDLSRYEIEKQIYKPAEYHVEGDWSSASYLLVLGAISGEVTVENLNTESLQGDRMILNYLMDMGASVNIGKTSITVKRSRLKSIQADLTDCIDLLPTMAVLAAVAEGVSEFTGVERARIKESNRVLAVKEGLERMGVKVMDERDKLTIIGSKPRGANIDPKNDHRIAMAFGVLGTAVGGTLIEDSECVSKTFPQFWDVLKSIGGEVKIDGE